MAWIGAAIGAVGGLIANNQNPSSGTATSSSNPWGGVDPYLRDLYSHSQYALLNPSPYVAQSENMQAQRALQGSPLTQAAQQQNLATVRGDYLDPATNPALQATLADTKTRVNANFAGDNFGSSAHQEWLQKGLLNAAAPYYEAERGRQAQATSLAPALANQDYYDIGQLGAVGAAPWTRLQNYSGLLQNNSGGQSSTTQPYYSNPYTAALGGGILGNQIYNSNNSQPNNWGMNSGDSQWESFPW